jgi:hypothetical protein
MKIVRMKCTNCGSTPTFLNQPLDVCRQKSCELCGIKLTVTGSEGEMDAPPMPLRERRVLTTKETNDARRLLDVAFGAKE